MSQDTCNFSGCPVPPTVAAIDDNGYATELLCVGHAVKTARAQAISLQYVDIRTGKPVLRVVVEVVVDENITT